MVRYVLVVAALASCTTTTAKVGLGLSGALMITGALVSSEPEHGFGPTPTDVGWTLAIAGAIIAIPCIAKLAWPPPEPHVDAAEARRRAIRERREQAWQLTQEAAAAATGGDCHLALELGTQIAAVDADFHDSVYLHNAAIARCMSQ